MPAPAGAQQAASAPVPLSAAARAALQIKTWVGEAVHLGDALAFMLEGEAVADAAPLRAERPAWPIAFAEALHWDRSLAEPVGPDCYCGPGNVKPAAEAAAARRAAWQRARDANPLPSNARP